MTAFLFITLFILITLCGFAVVLLFVRQNRLIALEKQQLNMIREIEDVASAFLLEMKEENETFIEKVQKIKRQEDKGLGAKKTTVDSEEEKGDYVKKSTISRQKVIAAYEPSRGRKRDNNRQDSTTNELKKVDDTIVERNNDDFTNQVLLLHRQGLTSSQIAKELSRGRTEVELVLKFENN
ncbi:hypothetical protein WAK64_03825 [Bacillus spongiae]|uniref:Swarming motility protein SwrB n=1 Tax=Bacillus spongiae TaxID=2683610 RepID=A0ABU8HAA9_9BACI